MIGFKCKDCGSTKGFYCVASVSYSGDTLDEIGEGKPEFLDWTSDVCCENCDDDNVERIVIKEKEANNA